MEKITFKTAKLLDDVPTKTFFPMRVLLRSEKFDEIIENKNLHLWMLFYMNNADKTIESNCIIRWMHCELMFSYFQELEITLHFIYDCTSRKDLQEFCQEIRLTLQNFILALNFGSYYIAFTEYRKLLDCCLRIRMLHETGDHKYLTENWLTNKEDNTFVKLYSKYCEELLDFWKDLSGLIHQQKDKMVCFNVNQVYGDKVKDCHNKYITKLIETSEIVYKTISSLLDLFKPNLYLTRYKKVLEHLEYERHNTLMLKNEYDYEENKNTSISKDGDQQEEVIKASKGLTFDEMKLFKPQMEWMLSRFFIAEIHQELSNKDINTVMQSRQLYDLFKKIEIEKYFNLNLDKVEYAFLTYYNIDQIIFNYKMSMEWRENTACHILLYDTIAYSYALLWYAEIKNRFKEIKLSTFRSYIEDYLYILAFGKTEMIAFISSLKNFAENNFGYKTNDTELTNYIKEGRHPLLTKRIKYISMEGKVTGSESFCEQYVLLLMDIIYFVLDKYYGEELDDYFNEENNIFKSYISIWEYLLKCREDYKRDKLKKIEDIFKSLL